MKKLTSHLPINIITRVPETIENDLVPRNELTFFLRLNFLYDGCSNLAVGFLTSAIALPSHSWPLIGSGIFFALATGYIYFLRRKQGGRISGIKMKEVN